MFLNRDDQAKTLNAGRLRMRAPGLNDLNFMTHLYSRREVVSHRPDPTPDNGEICAQRLERSLRHWSKHGFGIWVVETGRQPIGFGGLTVSSEFDALNLSYHLHPEYWGHGYATELVGAVLRFAEFELPEAKIIGLVRPANPASRRVIEKFGFSFEREVIRGGAPTNLFVLSTAIDDT